MYPSPVLAVLLDSRRPGEEGRGSYMVRWGDVGEEERIRCLRCHCATSFPSGIRPEGVVAFSGKVSPNGMPRRGTLRLHAR